MIFDLRDMWRIGRFNVLFAGFVPYLILSLPNYYDAIMPSNDYFTFLAIAITGPFYIQSTRM